MKPARTLHAFDVWIAGQVCATQINARNVQAARYQYFRDVREWRPAVRYIEVKARRAGPPVTTDHHRAALARRGRPELVAGARVVVGGEPGFITGSNCSSNFDVLLDHLRFALNVHPTDITLETST